MVVAVGPTMMFLADQQHDHATARFGTNLSSQVRGDKPVGRTGGQTVELGTMQRDSDRAAAGTFRSTSPGPDIDIVGVALSIIDDAGAQWKRARIADSVGESDSIT